MSQLGYDLAYGDNAPFDGDEGMLLALNENLRKHRLSGLHYTPNLEQEIDIERISKGCSSKFEFEYRLRQYLTT